MSSKVYPEMCVVYLTYPICLPTYVVGYYLTFYTGAHWCTPDNVLFVVVANCTLSDFRSIAFEGFNWILRTVDVNTSYGVSVAQKGKSAIRTGGNLASIWAMYGCPSILHSDNGSEFLGKTEQVARDWSGNTMKIIHGRPRHPESQGMVERSHGPFKKALLAAMEDHSTQNWPMLVPMIQELLNNCIKRGFTRTPYEMVFGLKPRAGYKNNLLPASVLDLLANENGIDAIRSVGLLANEDEVCAAIVQAQLEPMTYEEPEETSPPATTVAKVAHVGKPDVVPASQDAEEPGGSEWRKYDCPETGRLRLVPRWQMKKSDSDACREKKYRHHLVLEQFCRRFTSVGDAVNCHRVAHYIMDNNKVGQKGMKSFTRDIRADIISALPAQAVVVEEITPTGGGKMRAAAAKVTSKAKSGTTAVAPDGAATTKPNTKVASTSAATTQPPKKTTSTSAPSAVAKKPQAAKKGAPGSNHVHFKTQPITAATAKDTIPHPIVRMNSKKSTPSSGPKLSSRRMKVATAEVREPCNNDYDFVFAREKTLDIH